MPNAPVPEFYRSPGRSLTACQGCGVPCSTLWDLARWGHPTVLVCGRCLDRYHPPSERINP